VYTLLKSPTYKKLLNETAAHNINWDELAGKCVLVTGATGGIGSFLIDLINHRNLMYSNNINIVAISRDKSRLQERFCNYKNISIIARDITKEVDFNIKCDYIIHAASNTHPIQYASKPIDTITANVHGTHNLLELTARNKNCRIIFLSSVEIYGQNRGDVDKFAEDYCGYIDPNTLRAGYPESKRTGEALCQAYVAEKKVDAVILRLSRVYGPTTAADDSKAISQFIKNAMNCEDIVLKSNGEQLYSYAFIADTAIALLHVMLNGVTGEAYNMSSENSDVTLKELAEKLAKTVGVKIVFNLPKAEESKGYSTATKAVLNTEKLRNIGWKSRYDISSGLELTTKILSECK